MRLLSVTFLIIILMSHCTPTQDSVISIPLNTGWQFRQVGTGEWMPATVPGTVHTDLLENDKIEDPYYRTNEKNQQWIEHEDWEYKTSFITGTEINKDSVKLIFHGLDTYADVYLNDSLVLAANNMFRTWEANVKDLVRNGENELRIHFKSPIDQVMDQYNDLDFQYPASNDQAEKKVSIFTRKAGYHYGWDWGPRFVTSGIWRPVELLAWDDFKLEHVHLEQEVLNGELAEVNAHLEINSIGNQEVAAKIYVDNGAEPVEEFTATLTPGVNIISRNFTIQNPKRWWPNGLGDQTLYEVKVTLSAGKAFDEANNRIGLRTVELITEPDSIGTSMYFKVNDVPVFMKGANYIPSDNFLPRVTDEKYEMLIDAAIDANMNMLRVWGGGIYENDIFYDLCDEKGLLVWQDFMFACSMYPGDEAFLENVRQEAIDNIKRLRNHPSIALWCGNNENETAWKNWGWSDRLPDKLWTYYQDLFHELLPEVVAQYDTRPYWRSSPTSNSDTIPPQSPDHGDRHYWGVWHGEDPFAFFNHELSRFMSEFGFQSFPNLKTVQSYTTTGDWDIESDVMLAHQRHPRGNQLIREYMMRHYKQPKDFESFLYVSQILQAEGMKVGFEAHRRNMPLCMGSLYWQLNDCWPVASWSGMDYYGRWKAMHYYIKKAFAPILTSIIAEEGAIKTYLISDELTHRSAVLDAKLIDFKGEVLWESQQVVEIEANKSKAYLNIDLSQFQSFEKDEVVFWVKVNEGEQVLSENHYYFLPEKNLKLENPNIEYTVSAQDDEFLVTLTSRTLARNVYLTNQEVEGFFSDNFFDMMPGEKIEVIFTPDGASDGFAESLQVISLVDAFNSAGI